MSKPAVKQTEDFWSKRYTIQQGKFKGSFEIDSHGEITFYDGFDSETVKDFHFEDSQLFVVLGVADLLKAACRIAQRDIKAAKAKSSEKATTNGK